MVKTRADKAIVLWRTRTGVFFSLAPPDRKIDYKPCFRALYLFALGNITECLRYLIHYVTSWTWVQFLITPILGRDRCRIEGPIPLESTAVCSPLGVDTFVQYDVVLNAETPWVADESDPNLDSVQPPRPIPRSGVKPPL